MKRVVLIHTADGPGAIDCMSRPSGATTMTTTAGRARSLRWPNGPEDQLRPGVPHAAMS
jgi:hypothetical protein